MRGLQADACESGEGGSSCRGGASHAVVHGGPGMGLLLVAPPALGVAALRRRF